MRFIFTVGEKQTEKVIVQPCQVYFSMTDFHRFAQHIANSYEIDDYGFGTDFFTYKFTNKIEGEEQPDFLFAKVGQRKILGKIELWRKYVGPKGVEAMLKYPDKKKSTAIAYLDELMKELCIEEYGDKGQMPQLL